MRPHGLARNHLIPRHKTLGVAAQIDVNAISVYPLDDAGQQFTFAFLVFLDDLLALCLTHFLHDDLLGSLRCNSSKFDGVHWYFHEAFRLCIRIDIHRIDHAQLAVGNLEFGRRVIEHQPTAKCVVFTGLAIDCHTNIDVLTMPSARRRCQCGFDRLEYDVFVDTLLVRYGIDHQ